MSKEDDEPQPQSSSSQIQAVQEQVRNFNRPLRWFKLFCGAASAAGFAVGLRAAWVQAKPLKPGDIPRTLLLSSSGFAMQAFGIATLITVSGYVALLVIVSELMGVNTFKEFGRRTTNMFGDRFRISRGGGAGENYTSLTELFEALQQQQQKKDGESKDER